MDTISAYQRSLNMKSIRSRNTKPEIAVRRLLHSLGLRFRIHCSELPGKPDIVMKRFKTVIMVNGCFWHKHSGCTRSNVPKSNHSYWSDKLEKNVERDKGTQRALTELGWRVIIVWECELKDMEKLTHRLKGEFNVRN